MSGSTSGEKAATGGQGRVGFGSRPALLVVDLNRGFVGPDSMLAERGEPVVETVTDLIERCRAADVPIFYFTYVYSPEAEVWARKLPANRDFLPGSKLIELDPRLGRRPDETLIEKAWASPFFDTGLHRQLHELGVDTVIVTGVTTSGCVRASAIDGCSHGFRVIVPEEAVGDREDEPHFANLRDIELKYGDVVSIDELHAYLANLKAERAA